MGQFPYEAIRYLMSNLAAHESNAVMTGSGVHIDSDQLFDVASSRLKLSFQQDLHLSGCEQCRRVLDICRRWTRFVGQPRADKKVS